jgi:limonene-1,2-epoxide hydrolase
MTAPMPTSSTPESVVRDFCRAVERRDVPALLDFFSADAVYHNIPLAPLTGREAIASTLEQFITPATRVEFEIVALATHGSTVLTERVDRFDIAGKHVELPVMGAFEVTADGKIRAWRDYFDMQQFTSQLA